MSNHDGHDENDERDDSVAIATKYSMRTPLLSVESERVMTGVIACAMAVHRALGPGFVERIYKRAMHVELAANGFRFESERPVWVEYRGTRIPGQRIDLIVEGAVVVELKAIVRIDDVHRAQIVSYLRTTGLRGGLLVNFRVPLLKQGLRRIVL